ncbi:hypothetical protein EBR03_01540 [bacterium]|nr:hypothetical protein [bacterium]NBX83932.1 hypothetical protein [bacterium]
MASKRPIALEVIYPEPEFEVVEPAQEFTWRETIPENKDVPILRDIYEHRAPKEAGILFVNGKKASMMSEDTGTVAHELTHGIHSYLEKGSSDFAAFYVPGKGAVKVQKSLVRRIDIAPFIPKELRGIDGDGGRFHTYIQDKHGREPEAGTPFIDGKKQVGSANALYPWDEWVSYINGAKAALQAEKEFGKQNSDYLTGPVEFSIYALGSMMAVKKLDPKYASSDAFLNMKKAYAYFTRESMRVLKAGRETSLRADKGEAYLERFRKSNSTEARAMKDFIVSEFGAEWTAHTFGFGARPLANRTEESKPTPPERKSLWPFSWPFRSGTP